MVRKSGAFDLNRCTVRQLVQLSGIPLDNARKLVRFRGRQQRRARRMEEERRARLERRHNLRAELQEEEGEVVRSHRHRAGAVLGPVPGPGNRKRTEDGVSMLSSPAVHPPKRMSGQRHISLLENQQQQEQEEVHQPSPEPSHQAGLDLEPETLPLRRLSGNERRISRGSQQHSRRSSRMKSGQRDSRKVIVVEIRTPRDRVYKDHSNDPMSEDETEFQYDFPVKREDKATHYSGPIYSPLLQPQDLLPQQQPCNFSPAQLIQQETSMDSSRPPAQASPAQVPLAGLPQVEPQDPSGAFLQGPSPLQLQPQPQAYPEPTLPAPGPCEAAQEAGQGHWFQGARCKICGALERCWAKIRPSRSRPHLQHTASLETRRTTVLQRNQRILEERRRCKRWRRRDEQERERRREAQRRQREGTVQDGRSKAEDPRQRQCIIS